MSSPPIYKCVQYNFQSPPSIIINIGIRMIIHIKNGIPMRIRVIIRIRAHINVNVNTEHSH